VAAAHHEEARSVEEQAAAAAATTDAANAAGNRAFKSPLDRTDDATANDTPAATTCAADTGSAAGQASRASMSCHIPVKLHNENRDSVYALAKKTDAGLHR